MTLRVSRSLSIYHVRESDEEASSGLVQQQQLTACVQTTVYTPDNERVIPVHVRKPECTPPHVPGGRKGICCRRSILECHAHWRPEPSLHRGINTHRLRSLPAQ
jgi:hypothetical protein